MQGKSTCGALLGGTPGLHSTWALTVVSGKCFVEEIFNAYPSQSSDRDMTCQRRLKGEHEGYDIAPIY